MPAADREPRRDHEAVLITGVYGSGKSSVAVEIAHVLEGRDVPHAVLDLDFLTWFYTGTEDAHELRLLVDNLEPLVRNYKDVGVRYFILAGFVPEREMIGSIGTTLGMPLRVVRVTVPFDQIEDRLRADVTTGRRDDLRRAGEQLATYEGEGVEDLALSNEGPIRQLALEIIEWLGWK